MQKKLLVLLISLLLLTGCNSFRPSFIDENFWTKEDEKKDPSLVITPDDFDGPLGGKFDEEGNWIPDDPTIELTYKIPDIGAGFIFDANTLEVSPSLQVELVEFDIPGYFFKNSFLKWVRTWKVDFGVAYQRAFFYTGPRVTSIFEISVGGFCGWNFDEKDLSYGLGVSVIKF